MKKSILFFTAVLTFNFQLLTFNCTAQLRGINYQAVAIDENGKEIVGMDLNGQAINNKTIGVRFSILSGTATGPLLYQETHTTNTDQYGLFSLIIGDGSVSTSGLYQLLIDIPWPAANQFLKVEIAVKNDGDYKLMSVQQLMAVPYAFYSLKSDTALYALNADTSGAAGNNWKLTGNANTIAGTNFIGTTDFVDLVVKTDNIEKMRVTTGGDVVIGGNVGIGTSTPAEDLEVIGNARVSNLAGTGTRMVQADLNGTLIPLAAGTANQVLLGTGAWGNIPNTTAWSLLGNAGTVDGTNFIGTIDSIPFNIRVNNQKAGRIDHVLFNTFWGYKAGNANTSGPYNTAHGASALSSNTTGNNNTATGMNALASNITGGNNTAHGMEALKSNNWGSFNTATGAYALFNNNGSFNTANGAGALSDNTGNNNTANGLNALRLNTTGNNNVGLGHSSGYANVNGSGNVFLGHRAGYNETGSNKLYIANDSINPPLIYGDFSSGNVGIGTTSPGQKLTVFKDTTGDISWFYGSGGRRIEIGTGNTDLPFMGNLDTYIRMGGYYDLGVGKLQIVADGATPGGMGFWTGNYNSPAEHLTITKVGNIGIGTTIPGSELEIKDNDANDDVRINMRANATEIVQYGASSTQGFIDTKNKFLSFYTDGTSTATVVVNNAGNVGIGTTNPGNKLELNSGTANISGLKFTQFTNSSGTSANISGNVLSVDASGNIIMVADQTTASAGVVGGTGIANYVARWSNATTLSTGSIFDNGNVGIGTTLPQTKLHIIHDITDWSAMSVLPAVVLENTITSPPSQAYRSPSILFKQNYPGYSGYQTMLTAGNYAGYLESHYTIDNWATSYLCIRIAAAQTYIPEKLGIGETFPENKLDVAGAAVIGATYSGTSAPANGLLVQGNVGIGTTAPASKLDISDDVTPAKLILRRAGAGNVGISLQQNGYTAFGIVARSDGNRGLAFVDNYTEFTADGAGTDLMRITWDGKVGIGTSIPGGQFELSLDQGRKPATGTWTVVSDERLKNIEGSYTKGLKEILKLQPITYHYKNVGERKFADEVLNTLNVGFSAQEVQKIFPEAVGVDKDGYLNFNMHAILVAYVNAIKDLSAEVQKTKAEQQQIIENQTSEIKQLKTNVSELQKALQQVKSEIDKK